MQTLVDIGNERFEPEERLLVHEHSGDTDDLPREFQRAIVDAGKVDDAIELPAGHWVIVLDDDVILSEFTAFRIEVRDE